MFGIPVLGRRLSATPLGNDSYTNMNILIKFWDWYLEPKQFEMGNNAIFYRRLGIRLFKRYLPTSGDIISRSRGIRRIPLNRKILVESLQKYKRVTINYEWRHIFGGVSMLALSWLSIEFYNKGSWLWLLIANLIINGYPIMLQRYNRIRINDALSKLL